MSTALDLDHRPAKVLRFPDPDPFARTALEAVTETYGVASVQVAGRGRTELVAFARQVWMWTLREAGYSYKAIGRATGRDHGSVMHAVRVVEKRMLREPYTKARNSALLETLGVRQAKACPQFVGYVVGLREGDFAHGGRPSDICKRPGCGLNRARHSA